MKPHKGEYSTVSLSRKELQDEHFRSIFGGLPSPISTSKMALDPLLSFLQKASASDLSDDLQSTSSAEVVIEEQSLEETSVEGYVQLIFLKKLMCRCRTTMGDVEEVKSR